MGNDPLTACKHFLNQSFTADAALGSCSHDPVYSQWCVAQRRKKDRLHLLFSLPRLPDDDEMRATKHGYTCVFIQVVFIVASLSIVPLWACGESGVFHHL